LITNLITVIAEVPMKLLAMAVMAAVALAGCSSQEPAPQADDGLIHVVASTNVYGSIANSIGGDLVNVTSIIEDPSQDPHSYEGNARVQLALSKADIIIENGGGYDDWLDTLLAGANNPGAVVLNVADISGYDQTGAFNEHLWYDFPTVLRLADSLSTALASIDPSTQSAVDKRAARFTADIAGLQARESALAATAQSRGAAITEPVPNYLLTACGLTIVTPVAFSKAIEEGTDVSPLVLSQTLNLFAGGAADVLVYNEQTAGPQTEAVLAAAEKARTPVVPVTETLPPGLDYPKWMSSVLDGLEEALR
jgi:zinc/manganese transport system substrate-binding protein